MFMCVCMYVCIYVCMYVCMYDYVCMYVCIYVCMCIQIHCYIWVIYTPGWAVISDKYISCNSTTSTAKRAVVSQWQSFRLTNMHADACCNAHTRHACTQRPAQTGTCMEGPMSACLDKDEKYVQVESEVTCSFLACPANYHNWPHNS